LMDMSTISKLREEEAVVVAVQEQEVAAMN
jgi:hypothetical protein